MRRNFLSEAQKYIAKNRRRRTWKHIVIALACVVVFCTTYALILPAITVEDQDVKQVLSDAEYQSDADTGSDNTDESETTGQSGEEIDFTNWITSVTYEDTNGGNIEQWDTLSFKIAYYVPGRTLSEQNRTIVYTLPNNIRVEKSSSGDVVKGNEIVGTYEIDRDTGKITIIFNEEYAKLNENGSTIDGDISFKSSVSEIGNGSELDVNIEFSETVKVNINNINRPEQQTNDLKVEKTMSNLTNGIITYTITVSSENGTASEVSLKDVMNNVVFATEEDGGSGFRVTYKTVDSNGNESSQVLDCTPNIETTTDGKQAFDLILPKMNDGDQYIIEYKVKIDGEIEDKIYTENNVTVKSTSENNEKLTDSANVNKTFENELIKKTYNKNNGMIEWTIEINKLGLDITGWELSDTLNGVALPEDVKVTISPSPLKNDNSESYETTLPFTFTEEMKTDRSYTVTYRTPEIKNIDGKITNVAKLESSDGENGNSSKQEVYVGSFNPLKKEVIGITEDNDDENTNIIEADTEWKVTIDTTEGEIPAGWVLTDSLSYGSWFTEDQKSKIKKIFDNLEKDGYTNTLEWKTNTIYVDNIVKENVAVGFKVTFTKTLEKGHTIYFSYKSTGSLNDGYSNKTFNNYININNNVSASAEIKYETEPIVSKYDLDGRETNNTTHNFTDINGILGWGFKVNIPDRAAGKDIVITETLPTGVLLLDSPTDALKVKYNGVYYSFDFKDEAGLASKIAKVNIDGQEITATKDNNNNDIIIISMPSSLTAGDKSKQFEFEIRTQISDEYEGWTLENNNYKANFHNKVVVKIEDENNTTREASQTQTIIKEFTGERILDKSHGTPVNNIIPYSIVVNPNGEDLLADSETLTLKDDLKYVLWHLSQNVEVSFIPGSLHVYDYENGEKGEELSTNEFEYTISTGEDYTYKIQSISMTIPDGRALLVEYEYSVKGNDEHSVEILNTSFIEGESSDSTNSQSDITLKIQESQATATIKDISIYKVDSSNYANMLPGAEFKLQRWNGSEYVTLKDANNNDLIFETDEDGKFILKTEDKNNNQIPYHIAYDVAYKLKEITPPEGYIIQGNGEFEFYIKGNDNSTVSKPDNFSGTEYNDGSNIYIENRKDSTDITVEKKWFNGDGNMIEGGKPGDIKFRLYQKVINTTTNKVITRPYTNTEYILNQDVDWTKTIKNLPKRGTENGQTVEYSYYVVEEELTNYKAEYEYTVDGETEAETAENQGIVSGTITIKNTENVKYVLPETGILGGDISFILGGTLLMAGSLVYIYKRKHKRV